MEYIKRELERKFLHMSDFLRRFLLRERGRWEKPLC